MQVRTIRVGGMTCVNCQNIIEKGLKGLVGVEDVVVDYIAGTASVRYDETVIDFGAITRVIEDLGYTTPEGKAGLFSSTALQAAGILVIILALSLLLRAFSTSNIASSFPLAEAGMGYGMLLVIGLLTSVHCIAMCGGINLSQTLARTDGPQPQSPSRLSLLLPGVLYNGGRVISYTLVGVAVGALGSVITISDFFRHVVLLLAGIFMVLMGINMLGLFPALRRFTPRLPQALTKKIEGQKAGRGPLVIGILNGFLPCGPLQAMQLYALSTGSPIRGGIAMFLFCIGTVPLMFTLGAAGGILSGVKGSAFSQKAMKVGAVLVASMGVVMFTNGWSGAGFAAPMGNAGVSFSPASVQTGSAARPATQGGVQVINSTLTSGRYPTITVEQGIPVRWVINAPQGSITGCNNRFSIREYNIQHTFTLGDNVIEFTPERIGSFRYSCWMSMIHGTINVVAAGTASGGSVVEIPKPDLTPKPAGVAIPTDNVAIAQIEENGNYQTVEIDLTSGGFEPAIIVVQQRLPVLWTINLNSFAPGTGSIIFPAYYAQIQTVQGLNPIQLLPTTDFDFSTADNGFYGYVKVAADISSLDIEAIKAEVKKHETLIYPEAYFEEGRNAY